MLKREVLTVPCTQCGGKGLLGTKGVTEGPSMCQRCAGTGILNVRGFSNQPVYVDEVKR